MIDTQEVINELKTYNRYVRKKQEAINKYDELERQLEYLYYSYNSPSGPNMVETFVFKNGKMIKKLIPMPKLDPDPNRKEVIKKGIICKQCDLWDEKEYYDRKIEWIKSLLADMPNELSNTLKEVYIKKNIQKVADRNGYTVAAMYDHIRDDVEDYLKFQSK